MAKLTPPQKLDKVLEFLRSTENRVDGEEEYFATTADTMNYLLKECDYEATSKEMSRILNKLSKDDYITQNAGNCYLTYDGYMFEGYEKQIDNRNAENTRMGNLENGLRVNRNWILCLTILIAVGTLVAAVYYGIEIWKFFSQK